MHLIHHKAKLHCLLAEARKTIGQISELRSRKLLLENSDEFDLYQEEKENKIKEEFDTYSCKAQRIQDNYLELLEAIKMEKYQNVNSEF